MKNKRFIEVSNICPTYHLKESQGVSDSTHLLIDIYPILGQTNANKKGIK